MNQIGEVQSIQPYRLKNRQQEVGYHTASWSTKGYFLFGTPFIGVGAWITCVGLGWVGHDPSKVHAPLWVLAVLGLSFMAAGLFVWNMGIRQLRMERQRNVLRARYPGDKAMDDFPWDRSGYSPPRWEPVRKAWVGLAFMLLFLSGFNWWAFGSGGGPTMVKITIGLFDLFMLWGLYSALRTTWHAIKFAKTRLHFDHFPYCPNEPIELRVHIPSVLRRANKATLHLRGIREFYEVHGSGKNRSKRIVHEAQYEGVQEFSLAQLIQWPDEIRSQWQLPTDAPETDLTAEKPMYWELNLKVDLPGLDLEQHYLVPVYRTATTTGS